MRPMLNGAVRVLRSPDFWIPVALFLFAFVLRFMGVRGWLPYVGHPDEPKLIDSAVHIVKTGDLNPHLYIWPSLYTYLEALVVRAHVTWGTFRGYYAGPQSLPDVSHIFALAPSLYLWARSMTALVGALTVALMYVVGRDIFDGNRRIGVIAALLIAVSPLHVEYSHFGITDVPLGFMGLMVLWASYRLARTRPEPSPGKYDAFVWRAILAGLLVGVATGIKYNGLYLAVVPATAWFIVWRKSRRQGRVPTPGGRRPIVTGRQLIALVAIPVAALVAFLLCEPYTILGWTEFWNGFTFQVRAYLPAENLGQMWDSVMRHLTDLASSDSHLLVPAAMGAIVMLLNPMSRGRAWLLLPFPVIYLLLMSRFSLTYVRNMIVTMPFLALMAAYLIDLVVVQVVSMVRTSSGAMPVPGLSGGMITQSRRIWGAIRWALVLGVALFLMWEPLRISWAYSSHMANPDSRTLAWNWMRDHIRQGDRFAAELHPWQVQDWPDVLPFDVERPTEKQQLTLRPPQWYADHGYTHVVLNGNLTDRERDQTYMGEYKTLEEAAHFKGDKEGGKGPIISILATGATATPMMNRSGVKVEDFATLEGYDLAPITSTDVLLDPANPPKLDYTPGGAIGLNLYYRSLRGNITNDPDWQVWIHLVDPATGGTVAQLDVQPLSGMLRNYPGVQQIPHPVGTWHEGEMVAGAYNLPIPASVPPGTYRLETGLWVPPNGPGARLTSPTGETLNSIVLGEVGVKPSP